MTGSRLTVEPIAGGVAGLVEGAGELARRAVHTHLEGLDASGLSSVVAEVGAVVRSLRALTRQLELLPGRRLAVGAVTDDRGCDPADAVADCKAALDEAGVLLDQLSAALERAHNSSAHLSDEGPQ